MVTVDINWRCFEFEFLETDTNRGVEGEAKSRWDTWEKPIGQAQFGEWTEARTEKAWRQIKSTQKKSHTRTYPLLFLSISILISYFLMQF